MLIRTGYTPREGPRLFGEDDEDINTIVTPTTPAAIHTGPITRARALQLNYQVLSFLGNDSNVHENMMLPKLDTFVLLKMKGLAWRRMNIGARTSMVMMACARERKTELQVISDDFRTLKPP